MLRSLHLKLMLIMLLLITSLMTVVGAFLMTNVTSFYTDAFYSQMKAVFDESNTGFVQSLRMEAAGRRRRRAPADHDRSQRRFSRH